jgi:hypothetical protein
MILSEYWGSYMFCQTKDNKLFIPEGSKRILMTKDLMLGMFWYAYSINKFH